MGFISELKRRNVFRVGVAYLMLGWVVVEVTATVSPALNFPEWMLAAVTWFGIIGFPFALFFAWAFELTPEGLKRDSEVDHSQSITQTTGKKLDRAIIIVLGLALAYFAFDKLVLSESRIESALEKGRIEGMVESYGDQSIAVLPFVDMSAAADQEYMSDGIAEELLNLLAKVPELRVISRSSAFSKSWPPNKPVVLLNSLDPIALHWPVIEFAPVPGLPILPVIKAKLIIDCATRTPS